MELTIQAACQNPQNFMYIWASDAFLKAIPAEYANVIRGKQANQKKLLMLSAEKYGKTYNEYTQAIRQAFIDNFTMTPIQALIVLAQGGQVAGKNWKEGVFGIGATMSNTFVGHPEVTVRPEDGHILNNGADVTSNDVVYTTINKQAVPYQYSAKIDGVTYLSQYNKRNKKYFACSFTNSDGKVYNAVSGNEINASDSADIWGAIIQSIEQFINWLISLFGKDKERETINEKNTLPNQSADGFCTESGQTDVGTLLLLLAAGGVILSGGLKIKKTK